MTYMTPDHPDAFKGMRLRPHPGRERWPDIKHWCPKCRGYGGWNLMLEPGRRPFRTNCGQCNGWGWVNDEDLACIHEWKEDNDYRGGRCMHKYQCTKCPATQVVDSSD